RGIGPVLQATRRCLTDVAVPANAPLPTTRNSFAVTHAASDRPATQKTTGITAILRDLLYPDAVANLWPGWRSVPTGMPAAFSLRFKSLHSDLNPIPADSSVT